MIEIGTKQNSGYETRTIFQFSERNIRRLLPEEKASIRHRKAKPKGAYQRAAVKETL